MGKTMMGGATHEGNVQLLTPQQQQVLGGILGQPGIGQQAGQAYSQFLQPYDQGQYQGLFEKSVEAPAMQFFQQKAIPAIQQSFVDANAGSSSALNQALAQGAADLSTSIGSQYGNFFQQQQANQLSALGGLGGLAGQQQFQPLISQSGGILGPLLQAGGQLGSAAIMAPAAAAMMSSQEVKENIRTYTKGLDVINKLDVKIYDYIEKVGGQKDKVGIIAEKVPKEIQGDIDGIKAVDLYGLMGILINSVKELNKKIVQLEKK